MAVLDSHTHLDIVGDDPAGQIAAATAVGVDRLVQVGVDLAVFVFDCPDESVTIHRGVVCNPVVELPEGKERQLDDDDEGCLSYPGAFVDCARPDRCAQVSSTAIASRCSQSALQSGAT